MDAALRSPRRPMLADGAPVEWRVAAGLTEYPAAVAEMEARVAVIGAGGPELAWLVEHPPLYTAGTSARPADLLEPDRLPVFPTGRGGQFTYHGPGQRVGYVMLDLNRRDRDLRLYIATLEEWIINTLARLDLRATRRDEAVGVWIPRPDKGPGRHDKIAAIGVRVRHWVTFHGVALNVAPALENYAGIVPCGIASEGVTSLTDLGVPVSMPEVDALLRSEFEKLFGPLLTRSAAR